MIKPKNYYGSFLSFILDRMFHKSTADPDPEEIPGRREAWTDTAKKAMEKEKRDVAERIA